MRFDPPFFRLAQSHFRPASGRLTLSGPESAVTVIGSEDRGNPETESFLYLHKEDLLPYFKTPYFKTQSH